MLDVHMLVVSFHIIDNIDVRNHNWYIGYGYIGLDVNI